MTRSSGYASGGEPVGDLPTPVDPGPAGAAMGRLGREDAFVALNLTVEEAEQLARALVETVNVIRRGGGPTRRRGDDGDA